MTINVKINDHSARLIMSGRFDFKVHRDFKDAYMPLLDNAAIHEIGVEMNMVNYIDSSALGMLMLLHERAQSAHKTVDLLNASCAVSKMLEVANFDKVFNIRQMDSPSSGSMQSSYGIPGANVAPLAT